MKRLRFDARAALIGISLTLGLAAGGFAQVPEPQREPVPPEQAPPLSSDSKQVDEHKIDQFADAYIAVEEIQRAAAEELRATDDPQKAYELKATAEGRIIEAVERSGLRLDEFNRITEMMAADRELRLKIADRIRERRRS